MKPVSLAALVAASSILSPVAIAQESVTDPVVVTAARFPEQQTDVIGRVLVVTREDIAASGALSLPDVLRRTTGIQVRGLYGGFATDTALDMRGFGEGSAQRVLVLLNGRRLNPIDSASVDWAQIPLEHIDRVEILQGSGAVLYGDNAVGGVINIITSTEPRGGQVVLGYGSFDTRQATLTHSGALGRLSHSLTVDHRKTRGWRDNAAQELNNFAGNLEYALDHGRIGLELGTSRTLLSLPGTLTHEQYKQNPRQAETSDSYGRRKSNFVRPTFEYTLAEGLEFAAEASYGESESQAWFSNFWSSGYQDRSTRSLAFTPRVQWEHDLAGLPSRTVFGFDWYDGRMAADSANTPGGAVTRAVNIEQTSSALYVQNRTELTERLDIGAGLRRQVLDQSARDDSGNRRANDHTESVWEAGVGYRLRDDLRVFTRFGKTFRFANLDELTTFTGLVSAPIRPETGRFLDIGAEWRGAWHRLNVTAYTLHMEDEIAYNALTFENENLDRTRHRGVTVDGYFDFSPQWRLAGGVEWQRATFSAGENRGKRIPLTSEWKGNATLSYFAPSGWTVATTATWTGSRYFGGDAANVQRKLSDDTVVDVVISRDFDDWTLTARANNVFDRKYSPLAYNYGFGESYYPQDGRSFFVDVRRRF